MKKFSQRFQGLYWRQLFMTTGTVLLTLFLLGASFFLLSYNYARQERTEELKIRATVVARLSAAYLRDSRFASQKDSAAAMHRISRMGHRAFISSCGTVSRVLDSRSTVPFGSFSAA